MVAALMPVAKPKTFPYRALGARIAALRHERGMSQRDLAERIDKSEGYFARVETGESRPRQPVLRTIARVLGASYLELAILADYMTEEEAAQWNAPPHLVDVFREMAAPDVPRGVVLEAWEIAKALWLRGQRTGREFWRESVDADARQIDRADEPEVGESPPA